MSIICQSIKSVNFDLFNKYKEFYVYLNKGTQVYKIEYVI